MADKVLAKSVLAFSLLAAVLGFDFLSQSEPVRETSFLGDNVPLFRGNETHTDYFKLLRKLSTYFSGRN